MAVTGAVIDRHTLPPIADTSQLETPLSEPSDRLVRAMARLDGDITVLGAGGKMGPTLMRMARRAAGRRKIYGETMARVLGIPVRSEAR